MLDESTLERIRYEFATTPEPGATQPVADGLLWLRMPLPMALAHINLWLHEDSGGWSIIDTGIHDETTRDLWVEVLEGPMNGAPVDRVILTHMHPDHCGNAGWLCERLHAGLWMTREEYLFCRVLTADTGRKAPPEGVNFYRRAGFSEDALHRYRELFGMFGRYVAELPQTYTRMRHGDRLAIGGRDFEVIVGNGHSPEHACLFDAQRNLMISGDQLLPTISSNVSVYPTEPLANPLDDWLTSLARLKDSIPEDVLVLPAHGQPFRGAHERIDDLIDEHRRGLDEMLAMCREPRRVPELFPALFRAPIRSGNLIMATGETLAHLNYLIYEGEIERVPGEDGADRYRIV